MLILMVLSSWGGHYNFSSTCPFSDETINNENPVQLHVLITVYYFALQQSLLRYKIAGKLGDTMRVTAQTKEVLL